MVDFDHHRSTSRPWLRSNDYKVRYPDVRADIRDRRVRRRSNTRADTCASTRRAPDANAAPDARSGHHTCSSHAGDGSSRSRNVLVSGTRRVLKGGSRGRAKFWGNDARPSLVDECASGIKSTGDHYLSVSLPAASMLAGCSGWPRRATGVAMVRSLSQSQDSLPPLSRSSSIPSCSRPSFRHKHL